MVKVCPRCGSINITLGGTDTPRDMCLDCGFGDFRKDAVGGQGKPQFFPEMDINKVEEFQKALKKLKSKNK